MTNRPVQDAAVTLQQRLEQAVLAAACGEGTEALENALRDGADVMARPLSGPSGEMDKAFTDYLQPTQRNGKSLLSCVMSSYGFNNTYGEPVAPGFAQLPEFTWGKVRRICWEHAVARCAGVPPSDGSALWPDLSGGPVAATDQTVLDDVAHSAVAAGCHQSLNADKQRAILRDQLRTLEFMLRTLPALAKVKEQVGAFAGRVLGIADEYNNPTATMRGRAMECFKVVCMHLDSLPGALAETLSAPVLPFGKHRLPAVAFGAAHADTPFGVKLVRLALAAGHDSTSPGTDQMAPLVHAAMRRSGEVIQMIMETGNRGPAACPDEEAAADFLLRKSDPQSEALAGQIRARQARRVLIATLGMPQEKSAGPSPR